MKHYNCDICGKKHDFYYGIDVQEPLSFFIIPEEERESRVKMLSSKYIIDNEFLLFKGNIDVETQNWSDLDFCWTVWIKISSRDFEAAIPRLKNGETVEINGVMDSDIPFYDRLSKLKASCFINMNRDEVKIKVLEQSPIFQDQQNPISLERAKELQGRINHSPKSNKNSDFEHNFDQRLEVFLQEAIRKFGTVENDFVINLNTDNSILFQIINSKMLNLNQEDLTIYIPFDISDIELKDQLEAFKMTPFYREMIEMDLDGIPTLYKCFEDIECLKKMVKDLIIDFYREDIESVDIDVFDA